MEFWVNELDKIAKEARLRKHDIIKFIGDEVFSKKNNDAYWEKLNY